ncbi:hypothetical protein [Nocardioides campestrisoli]|uniref:hypothetical protein n=1 Tax=Nocardioides campestrisoli TaxID=2736757 RepID=UPI0015E79E45|nr:hypothetical protein [Nocardioides campestrisoli]
MQQPDHSLSIGGLSLVKRGRAVVHPEGFTTSVSADGTEWGNPAAVIAELLSGLSDGEIRSRRRTSNREPVIYVQATGANAFALEAAEKALMRVTGRPADVVWTPPLMGTPTVFDASWSELEFLFDDAAEMRGQRKYRITFSALPWARSQSLVVTPAAASGGPTVVNDCSSATGWASSDGAVTVVSGAVVSTYDASVVDPFPGTTLTLTQAIDTSANHHLGIDWKSSIPSLHALQVGVDLIPEARRESLAGGRTRSWYYIPDSTLRAFTFGIVHSASAGTATLSVDQVVTAPTLPVTGTARQLTRTIKPAGSVPAEGTIVVQHETNALGDTIVYTHPLGRGYNPALMPFRTSSAPRTSNSLMVSGAHCDLSTPLVFSVPISAIPDGGAQLWLKAGVGGVGGNVRFAWSATSWQSGHAQVGSRQSGMQTVPIPVGPHRIIPIGRMTLPPSRVSEASGFVVFIVEVVSGSPVAGSNVYVDEGWVFAMERGTLSVINAGNNPVTPGLTAGRLRISAPSLETPHGSFMVATAADWSDAWEPNAENVQVDQKGHTFDPEVGSMVYVVTTDAPEPSISFEHYPRGHTHAPRVEV